MDASLVEGAFVAADRLALTSVPERVRSLPPRLRRPLKGVAILGLVNRGKSTLFNRLLGVELSAVAETPETAATIAATTGASSAHGLTWAEEDIELPSDPNSFREAARRDQGSKVTVAWVNGGFRLPPGLTLIDTPGVDEAIVDADGELLRLSEQWKLSGASAAVVVLAVPGGPSARDRTLLEHAEAAFPGAVTVALKPTSSGIPQDDLEESAAYAQDSFGVPVLVLPDEHAGPSWGSGPFALLEDEIDRIADLGARRLSADLEAFDAFVEAFADAVEGTSLADLATLNDLLQDGLTLPDHLDRTLRRRREELEQEREALRRDAETAARQEHLEVLDGHAGRLRDSLKELLKQDNEQATHRVYEDLLNLAAEGSPVAIQAIQTALRSTKRLRASGFVPAHALSLLPVEDAVRAIRRSDLPSKVLLATLSSGLSAELKHALERRTLRRLEIELGRKTRDHREQLRLAAELADRAELTEVRDGASTIEGDLLLEQLRTTTNSTIDGLDTWRRTWNATKELLAQQRRHDDRDARTTVERGTIDRLVSDLCSRAIMPLQVELAQRYQLRATDLDTWETQTRQVEEALETALQYLDPNSPAAQQLREDLQRSRSDRPRWRAETAENANEAQLQHRRIRQLLNVFLGAAGGLWAISILMLPLWPGAATAVWLVSFIGLVTVLILRKQHRDRPWSDYLTVPTSPVTARWLPSAGWYPDPYSVEPRDRWWSGLHWTHVVTPSGRVAPTPDAAFTPTVPPGWLPDPTYPGQWRWWDGEAWSDRTISWELVPDAPDDLAGTPRSGGHEHDDSGSRATHQGADAHQASYAHSHAPPTATAGAAGVARGAGFAALDWLGYLMMPVAGCLILVVGGAIVVFVLLLVLMAFA